MRLERFSIQNYRSITKAEKLPLGDLTVLVGPNNEGKSNILQALVVGMEELSSPTSSAPRRRVLGRGRPRDEGYFWERDYPQALQATDPNGRSIMDFDFSLTPEEVDEFHTAVGSRLNGLLPLRLSFGSGRPIFTVRKQRHSAALSAKRDEIAGFVAERVQVQYVPAVRTAEKASEIVRTMVRSELRAAAREDEYAAALDRLRELQRPVLESLSAAITERVQSVLPDVRAISVELAGDERALLLERPHVIVDDGIPTDLEFKGDGVQSLAALSLIQHYSSATARAKEFILAVEEPEAHLHPKAIHALRAVIRETSERQQVVVTTHSPLFVNRLEIARNIIVERRRARPASSVQELREILGVRASDNLESAEVVLVVEGHEDETALRPLLAARSVTLARAMGEGTVTVYALHGGGNLSYVLTQLRDSLASVHAFLDADEAGNRAAAAATQEGLLDVCDQTFAMCPGRRESEFEDLVDPDVYRDPVLAKFGVEVDTKLGRRGRRMGKWSSRMGLVFQACGQRFDDRVLSELKRVVAEAVAGAPQHAIKQDCESVIATLVCALERKLDDRRA